MFHICIVIGIVYVYEITEFCHLFPFQVTPLRLLLDLGSDVSMSCKLPHMPEAATLQWEAEDNLSSNTTLFYNNTAYVIIHSVDQQNKKRYDCVVRLNGTRVFGAGFLLDIEACVYSIV